MSGAYMLTSSSWLPAQEVSSTEEDRSSKRSFSLAQEAHNQLLMVLCFNFAAIPDKPTIVSVERSPNLAVVKWKFGEDGGSPLISLTLQYILESSVSTWKQVHITPPDITQYTIVDLEPNTYYKFRILATNEIGNSPPSSIYLAKTTKSGKYAVLTL